MIQAGLISSLLLFAEEPTPAQTEPGTGIGCTDRAIVSCTFDESARADMQRLRVMVRDTFAPFGGEAFSLDDIQVHFVGRARTADLSDEDDFAEAHNFNEGRRAGNPGGRMNAWRLFSPGSQNEFEIVVPVGLREQVERSLAVKGLNRPTRGRQSTPPGDSPEGTPTAPTMTTESGGAVPVQPAAWSDGVDNRIRLQPVNTWPWRTIGDMGGCTGTFIGPRHVVTAGHCLYSRQTASWGSSFTVRPMRDAGSVPYSTTVPDPSGRESWYFTPQQWRASSPSGGAAQYDFGILVTPDRFGDEVGHMGYGTFGSAELASRTHLLRGYPFCESETANPERIDEPNPCVVNALYGAPACTLGTFSKKDPMGWNRRVTHGCDASAANSGSALYTYVNPNDPWVFMIHTTSLKCAVAGDSPCTSADDYPLEATRITPEYSGWISYFRNLFP